MPVYRRHRVVHIHIPKTGGTAIENQFVELDDMTWSTESWYGQCRHENRWYEYHHLTLREFRELAGSEFDSFTRVAAVRDPYHRLLSDFLWRTQIGRGDPSTFLQQFDDFETFIRAIPKDIDRNWDALVHDADMSTANFLIHVRPQYHYLISGSGAMEKSIRLLRYESLASEIEKALLDPLEIVNTTIVNPRPRDLEGYYTDELVQIVTDLYQTDFALLGYPTLEAPM